MPIRILIVDRYRVVCEGLRVLLARDLELAIVGEATDEKEAIEKAHLLRPDLIVMDPQLPGQDGIATLAAMRRELPETQIIVLTSPQEGTSAASAMRAGAIGYLTKDIQASDLRAAIKAAAAGQIQLPSPASTTFLD
jgi:NarL family two-component system response regulator LiaR